MPGMDGIALLQEIRERYPEIFVLILTGVNSANEAVRAMNSRCIRGYSFIFWCGFSGMSGLSNFNF